MYFKYPSTHLLSGQVQSCSMYFLEKYTDTKENWRHGANIWMILFLPCKQPSNSINKTYQLSRVKAGNQTIVGGTTMLSNPS